MLSSQTDGCLRESVRMAALCWQTSGIDNDDSAFDVMLSWAKECFLEMVLNVDILP